MALPALIPNYLSSFISFQPARITYALLYLSLCLFCLSRKLTSGPAVEILTHLREGKGVGQQDLVEKSQSLTLYRGKSSCYYRKITKEENKLFF